MGTIFRNLYPGGIDNFKGESRDQRNLDFWANRASKNSDTARGNRATGSGRLDLPSTGKVDLHDTAEEPPIDMTVEAAMTSPGDAYSASIPDD